MWYYFNDKKFYKTELSRYSIILKEFFMSIEIPLYSSARVKTDYEKNLEIIKREFKNSSKVLVALENFDNLLKEYSKTIQGLKNLETLKEIVKININVKEYLRNPDKFYTYNDLIKENFDVNFMKVLKELNDILWEYLRQKDNRNLSKEYYKMLYDSLEGKIYCPFCGINELKSPESLEKLSPLEHFIPKGNYPFVSWNTDNIFIACEDCNSIKGEKSLRGIEQHSSEFFPIKIENYNFILKLLKYDILENKCEVEILVFENGRRVYLYEYLETWDFLFNIKKRIEKEMNSFIKKAERIIKKKRDRTKYYDLENDIEIGLEIAEEEGNIVEIAYYKYKKENLISK